MDAGAIFGRGVAFPPRVGADGRVAWSEGETNIRESIRVILLTDRGERINLASFGGDLAGLLFEPNTAATREAIRDRIDRALAEWEPRIRVQGIDVEPDPDDREAATATITYRLVATQALERVSVKVSLGGQG
jgi:phage baseplate assembly protein W